jgi:hypothetical protein
MNTTVLNRTLFETRKLYRSLVILLREGFALMAMSLMLKLLDMLLFLRQWMITFYLYCHTDYISLKVVLTFFLSQTSDIYSYFDICETTCHLNKIYTVAYLEGI